MFYSVPRMGWQGNTIRKGAKRPENRVTRFPAGREGGAVKHQKGGSHRRWLIIVMLILPYDTESKSRNADFISIARRAIRHPQRRRRCRPLSEANTTCRRQAATTLGPKGRQPSPLNPLNLLNPMNPHAAGVSSPPLYYLKEFYFFARMVLL